MPDNASGPIGSTPRNPFDVPKGRWKVYTILTAMALALVLIGVVTALDLIALVGLMAALFLGIAIVYSFMNEKGL